MSVGRKPGAGGLYPLLLILWLGPAVGARAAHRLAVGLPQTGAYACWVQDGSGAVSLLPKNARHTRRLLLTTAAGDTLCVLDGQTGQVAQHLITDEDMAHGLVLRAADFQPLPPGGSGTPPAGAPANARAGHPAPRTAASAGPGLGRLVTWLLGAAVTAGVIWVLMRLVQTRFEPLIPLARRFGVQVPEATPLGPELPAPVYEPPAPRAPEKIPEEAGAAPVLAPAPRAAAERGPAISLTGVPQLVGTQGLAAGSTFALTDPAVSIGRDGGNEIVLAENTVSRRHALLAREPGGQITIKDQNSANGIYVNGERVQRAILTPGDEIKIGDNIFRFEA